MMQESCAVYILAHKKEGVLYIGVTSDIKKRVWEHKQKVADGFTKKYNVDQLVYFEMFSDIDLAIKREKCLKKYKRSDKIKLIEENNPSWNDLYDEICS